MFSSARRPARRLLRLCPVGAAVTALYMLTLFGQAASAAHSERTAGVAAQRTVALMFAGHRVFRAPRQRAAVIAHIAMRRPITGERTALLVSARTTDSSGIKWLRVMLPGRPNSSSGWIRERTTRLTVTPWHLLVDLRTRTVGVYLDGRRLHSFRAVVGKSSTPTPTGAFFVEETVKMPAGEPGAPFALALSARSNVLRHFDGGPGQVAIHGRDDLGGTLGAAQDRGSRSQSTTANGRFGPPLAASLCLHTLVIEAMCADVPPSAATGRNSALSAGCDAAVALDQPRHHRAA